MAHAEKRGKVWRVKYKVHGKWESASKDDFGNRFATERLAEQYGQALEADARRGKRFVNPTDGKITMAEYAEAWLESIDVGALSDGTYRSRIRSQILPEWGTTDLRDITVLGYRAWKKRLSAAHKPNYVSAIEGLFRLMLEDAVAQKLIDTNPVPSGKAAKRGRYQPPPGAGQDSYIFPTPFQALCVAENARTARDFMGYVMVLTMAYSGMRIGEISGLLKDRLWLSDDPYGSAIRVDYQGQWIKGKGWQLIPPKYASYRTLILPPFLAELLRELRDSTDSQYVFTSVTGRNLRVDDQFYGEFWHPVVDGRPAEPQRKGTRGRPALRPVEGVRGMVPHGTRHGHKVWLDEDGHSRVAVETRMGHKSATVEALYSHVTPEMERRVAQSLQARWERSLGVARTTWAVWEPAWEMISQESPIARIPVPSAASQSASAVAG
ncbi:site-specific integrase [Kitasatospora sp. MBT63]|uniref:tyrosine-type recombinase/integrase n=1 Tax=Kitasatospora sp. MBT63 TaxID=1444768 RepID=UPI00053A2349|nr:site-specific integrase [Kitasatospora sp. MBT63]